ncbi:DUF3788 family protein [bacterium]|nr:DUF3788 family protein [bacterium]
MEKPCLKDSNIYPDDDVLSQTLGKVKPVWDGFTGFIREAHPAYVTEWRYYKDGWSWLFKVTLKKNTICWVSVFPGKFKTTFYFGDKAEPVIVASPLGQEYKDMFLNGKRYGKIRAITVEIRKSRDLDTTKFLMDIKEGLK